MKRHNRIKPEITLSVIRAGEYEGFFKKIKLPEWKPDFGPAEFDAQTWRHRDWRQGFFSGV